MVIIMDKINIEILEDGQLKITTDSISAVNHCSADELLRVIFDLMGGTTTKTKTRQGHTHVVNGTTIKHSH
jgi:hypothetical protein